MNNITDCNRCIFCETDKWCLFDIPSAITNKNIKIDQENFKIQNYACSYAFGKETFEKNQDKINKDSIIQYIYEKNKIRYSLIINFDTVGKSVEQIIDKTLHNSFKPVNIVCLGKTIESDMVSMFEKALDIPWRTNKILPHIDEQISIISSVDTITHKHNSNCFFYISSSAAFDNMEELMNQIHTESVINQNYGIHLHSVSELDGLFMTYDTYNLLGASDKTEFFYDTKQFQHHNPSCKFIYYQ